MKLSIFGICGAHTCVQYLWAVFGQRGWASLLKLRPIDLILITNCNNNKNNTANKFAFMIGSLVWRFSIITCNTVYTHMSSKDRHQFALITPNQHELRIWIKSVMRHATFMQMTNSSNWKCRWGKQSNEFQMFRIYFWGF